MFIYLCYLYSVDQLNALIPLADKYNIPIYIGHDTAEVVCSKSVFYFGNFKSTYGPMAYMKSMLIFGDVFIILQDGNTFWNSAAENVKELKKIIKEQHVDDREIECCKSHTMEEVVDYIHLKMPNGGLIYTFFNSLDFKSILTVIRGKGYTGYYVTTLNHYDFETFALDPVLYSNAVFMGTFPYFDNAKPESDFTTFIREMGVDYDHHTYAEIVTMNDFYNSVLIKKSLLSTLSTLDNSKTYGIVYSKNYHLVDGVTYIGKNNFIAKNWYISRFDKREIMNIVTESLPFPQIRIPFSDIRCDATEENILSHVIMSKVAVQKYTEPYPSLNFLLFYESAIMLYYSSYEILGNNQAINEYVFDGNAQLDLLIDEMVEVNVSHIFVFDYQFEISKKFNRQLKESNILLWNIKLNHDQQECYSNMYILLLLLYIIIYIELQLVQISIRKSIQV